MTRKPPARIDDGGAITIDLGLGDLCHFDLLVSEGLNADPKDFTLDPIERHAEATGQSVARKRVEREAIREAGGTLPMPVPGIAADASADPVRATIASDEVPEGLHPSGPVNVAFSDRVL